MRHELSELASPSPARAFATAGGEMAALVREKDWSRTPLGPVEHWPQSLVTAASLCLSCPDPSFLFWGPEATCLYNDAWRASLGAQQHPHALGQRGPECWSDLWPAIGPQIDQVMTRGEPVRQADQPLLSEREGRPDEIYFSCSFVPVLDERGAVGGTLATCIETTGRVVAQRRLSTLNDLRARMAEASGLDDALERAAEALSRNAWDIPFALFYRVEPNHRLRLARAVGIDAGSAAAPESADADSASPWPFAQVLAGDMPMACSLEQRFESLPGGAWPEPARSAVLLPIRPPGQAAPLALLVLAASPRRVLDEDYAGFFDLVASQVGAALAAAAREQPGAQPAAPPLPARDPLGAALDNIADGVITFDDEWRYTYVNPAGARMLRREPSELLGRVIWDLYPDALWTSLFEQFHRAVSQNVPLAFDIHWPKLGWFENRCHPTAGGMVLYMSDISERKRGEQSQREADRRKDEFLATLAHELRNPLAPMRNAVQIMRLAARDPGRLAQAVAMMERQLGQMVRLIDDLLDISRITQGKLPLRRGLMDLMTAVNSAVETSRPLIEAGEHEFETSLPEETIPVEGDLTRLAQVFANLLNNAARYTRPGGHIRLAVEREGQEVAVSVTDDGIGIPTEALSHVFEMFAQVHHQSDLPQGGLGIGLSLVRGITELHGGRVEVHSEGRGCGARFTVRLPIVGEETAGAAELAGELRRPGRTLRILVADDNHDAAGSLALLLELFHHEVRVVHDGFEAVQAATEFRPHLVFMDLGMPRLDGIEATRRIREQPGGREIVIYAVTGWGQETDRARSRGAGCNGHFVKPVEPAELERLLGELSR